MMFFVQVHSSEVIFFHQYLLQKNTIKCFIKNGSFLNKNPALL